MSQIDSKNEEIGNFKKDFEKTLYNKEKKIVELQGVINQTYMSYNTGVNNIKISNKINEEISSMMKKMKIEDNMSKAEDNKPRDTRDKKNMTNR